MRRSLTSLVAISVLGMAVVAAPAAAQTTTDDDGERSWGVKAGLIRSNFAYEQNQDLFSAATGWTAGVFATGDRDSLLTWMGEINLLRKSQLCGCNQGQVDLYYLQIPGLLRVNSTTGELNLYGVVGPALEFKIGEELGSHIISDYSGVDVSLVAGVGVDVGHFLVEVRGGWGLRNLIADGGDVKVTSRTLTILAGFTFD